MMATSLQPALWRLVDHYRCTVGDSGGPIPEWAFLYGVHASPTRISILVHFPSYVVNRGKPQWEFRQVLVAQHWITFPSTNPSSRTQLENAVVPYTEDECLLDRWRLVRALFAARAHTMSLYEILGGRSVSLPDVVGLPSISSNGEKTIGHQPRSVLFPL